MTSTRHALIRNLARHAGPARVRMALTVAGVGRLTGLSPAALAGIERGDEESELASDELVALATFLGLTAVGTPRTRPSGSLS